MEFFDALSFHASQLFSELWPIIAGSSAIGMAMAGWGKLYYSAAEDSVLDSLKQRLKSLKDYDHSSNNWVLETDKIFDSFFGRKHLSWKCFWRSCLISVSTVLLVLLIHAICAASITNTRY